MFDPVNLLVLATRSRVAQTVIARRRKDLQEVLATSPLLDPVVADSLVESTTTEASRLALRVCQDTDLLEEAAGNGVRRARWALRNPRMPLRALTSPVHLLDLESTLALCTNPATPLEYRQSLLTRDRITELTAKRSSLAFGVVRSYELAIANTWLLDRPELWSWQLRRGLTGLPEATPEQYADLTKKSPNWPARTSHPAATGCDLSSMSVDALRFIGNPAVDLHLLGRPELTTRQAARMVHKRWPRTARYSEVQTEPHIIGRLVARFGVGVLDESAEPDVERIANTRVQAAEYSHPAARYVGQIGYSDWLDAEEAAQILGDNQDAWETALGLSSGWESDLVGLAETALGLVRA